MTKIQTNQTGQKKQTRQMRKFINAKFRLKVGELIILKQYLSQKRSTQYNPSTWL